MSPTNHALTIFEGKQIRRHWDNEKEEWLFSVVDIVGVLSESNNPRNYWKVLKIRLKREGSQLVTKCNQLKLKATDGKYYQTDVANLETTLRLIQSIPSPNAEPFKLWLAEVGKDRVEEMQDPEIAINRALRHYLQLGYTEEWINQRLKSIEVRKELTNEWTKRGVKEGWQFAQLTDVITQAWAGIKTKEYKELKNLKKQNLRDHMSNLEIVLNMLAEASTTEISKKEKPTNFPENKKVARKGGGVAYSARKQLEKEIGRSVVSKSNFLDKGKNDDLIK